MNLDDENESPEVVVSETLSTCSKSISVRINGRCFLTKVSKQPENEVSNRSKSQRFFGYRVSGLVT